jgi:uncharacterized protein involved in type VI secretion and phage assembly
VLERILTLIQEKVENRYYGKYRAIVVDNQDPDNRGRLKVKVPALLGETEIGWAVPCVPYGGGSDHGFYFIPEIDAGVWVEFEGGRLSYPIWSGTWWGSGEAPTGDGGASPVPDLKLIKTKGGHLIQLDDSGGGEAVTVTDSKGNKVVMDASGIQVDAGSRDLVVKANAIKVEATANLTLKGAEISVEASGAVTIKGATVSLNP